jgi:glutamate/tyrosine decarboxylase-like PLP-dependent enzyme
MPPTSPDAAFLEKLREVTSRPLPHPSQAELKVFGEAVAGWSLAHFASLPEQRIGQTLTRAEAEALLRESPPESGCDFAHVLAEFAEKVAPNGFRTNHPRFLAFVPGAPTYVSVLGDWLCSSANFFAGVWLEASGPAQVELIVLDWFKELLGYPDGARGVLTSGGSEANLTALVVARERLSNEDRQRAVLLVTQQRHWSIDRSAKIAGLRPDQIRPVPSEDPLRLNAAALRQTIASERHSGRLPWLVVANAGATNTGCVDDLNGLADVCGREGIWLHVDAAYGWSAVLTPEGREELRGIDRADSLTLDPHKWFAQTFEAGCVLVRDGRRLGDAFTMRPEYMQDVTPADDEINFADHGPALTRRFRALKIWLSVKVLGLAWFRRLVEHCFRLADFAEALLRQSPGVEILCPRRLSIVCFRYVSEWGSLSPSQTDKVNLAIIEEVRATGRSFFSSTLLQEKVALRLCFVNWRTTSGDVEEVVRLICETGRRLAASFSERSGRSR